MAAPVNAFKRKLREGGIQIGCWLNMGSVVAAEIAAASGFDWCLIDGEHGPYDIGAIRDQLISVSSRQVPALVRVPDNQDWVIKQVLDLGAQTIMVPMVDSAEQAEQVVRATRYPPAGIRGMGAAVARASDYGATGDYVANADDEICVIVQIETPLALENLERIAAVDGVDALFIGPSDLSASMGYPGNTGTPDVEAAFADALTRIRAAGKAAGMLSFDPAGVANYAELGANLLGVAADVSTLGHGLRSASGTMRKAIGR